VQGPPLFTLQSIPVLSREELALRHRAGNGETPALAEAAQKALPFYSAVPVIGNGKLLPASIPASSLRLPSRAEGGPENQDDGIALLLRKAGLSAADFGTIVHAFLEDRLSGRPSAVPPRILARFREGALEAVREEALVMAERFLASDLGKKRAASLYWESEFPIVTAVKTAERTVVVTGQIDLLFEEGDVLHVVDFKTDKIANPEDHYGQLAVYKRAVEDIFGKPVHAWLYYLRTGNAVELPLDNVSIEAMVCSALQT
jgi:hypothetical protein